METENFIAVLEGSDANLKHEGIVYTAHWDHFGISEAGTVSGAVDNASGCAGVLALARAFASLKERPPRSVVFFLPTLEERGLLGSRYYVINPVLKMSDTLAVLNLEMLNLWGLGPNFSSVCKGHSSLDQFLEEAATRQKRTVVPESEPEKGYLYRSDHLPFMQAGVPCLAIFFPCADFMEKRQSYIKNDYHKVTDKVKDAWNLDGAAADTILMFDVGLRLLQTGYRAKWNDMSEFRRP
jgi:Zn-dependent M28 family amino/carboxypeptidase